MEVLFSHGTGVKPARAVLMRRLAAVVVAACVIGVAAGCGIPGDGSSPRDGGGTGGGPGGAVPGVDRGRGTLALHLPDGFGSSVGTLAVDTPSAIAAADVVEIVVLEASSVPVAPEIADIPVVAAEQTIELPVSEAPTVEFELLPGLYRVLVLAGKKAGTTATLLGSGATATPVEVTADAVTDAHVTLQTISHTIEWSTEVTAGGTFTASVSGNTNNPLLTLTPADDSSTCLAQHRMDGDTSYATIDLDIAGGAWSGEATCAVSSMAGETGWRFSGPYVTYVDPFTGAYTALNGVFPMKWRWLSSTVVTESSSLWEEVWKPVTITGATTGVAVTVEWL